MKYIESKLCIKPWTHLVQHTSGLFSPCCKIEELLQFEGRNAETLDEAWRSESLVNLRSEFLEGKKPSICHQCWREESAGLASDRILTNDRILRTKGEEYFQSITSSKKPTPISLDLKISNICNLKCRICSVTYSSQILNEYANDLNIETEGMKVTYSKDRWSKNNNAIEVFKKWLPTIEYIEVYGGEPFLQKDLEEILSTCIKEGRANKISLRFHTNGMVDLRNWFVTLKEFENVEIHFSLDDIGPRLEYQRSGSKWAYIKKNFERVKYWELQDPIKRKLGVFATYSIYNSMSIVELLNWADSLNSEVFISTLQTPPYLNIQNFPDEFRKKVIEYLRTISGHKALKFQEQAEEIIRYVQHGNENSDLINEFCSYTGMLDRRRGEKFSEIFSILDDKSFEDYRELFNDDSKDNEVSQTVFQNVIDHHEGIKKL